MFPRWGYATRRVLERPSSKWTAAPGKGDGVSPAGYGIERAEPPGYPGAERLSWTMWASRGPGQQPTRVTSGRRN
jgi:hypothetical protein